MKKVHTIKIRKCSNGRNYSATCYEEGMQLNHTIHHHEIKWAVWDYLSKGFKVHLDIDSLKHKLS